MKVIISEFMEHDAVERLALRFQTLFDPKLAESRSDLLAALTQAQAILIRNRTQIDTQLLDAAPNLRVVGRLGVGLDNIDMVACQARGIEVIPATGANSVAVAEYVICTAMMLLRGAYFDSTAVASGEWPRQALSHGQELAGKRLGVVGLGNIGGRVAELGVALGMDVCASGRERIVQQPKNKNISLSSLDELVATSDVISLHIPSTDSTYKLFDRDRLAQMKPGAILINPARGEVVDELALAELLHAGHLAGAALDVFTNEPLPAHPVLMDVPNLILTPHIAGLSLESNQRVSHMIAERVISALQRL